MEINNHKISSKLHELLIEDLDFRNSETNKLVQNISLNIILTNLTQEERFNFYKLISEDNYEKAAELVKKEIPNFENKIQNEIKKSFKKIL